MNFPQKIQGFSIMVKLLSTVTVTLFCCLSVVSLFPTVALCQTITARQAVPPIRIDAVLDEKAWAAADSINGLTQFVPVYNQSSPYATTIYVLYDSEALYVAFRCLDPDPDKITAKDTMRDAFFQNDDAIVVLLDTFNDKNSAYYFGVNPLGTIQDGRLADNGGIDDIRWDGRWQAAARITQDGWVCEVAIPFSTLKYDAKADVWGFTVERRVARNRERSFWTCNLVSPDRVSTFGVLTGLDLTTTTVKRHTIIPYVQLQVTKGEKPNSQYGVDVRYNITSRLGVEATVNPDFATVEADVEQVNLTRFELSYPEKRPFFLEGAENYSTRIQQFYSRRIGEIPWGVKLNGKVFGWKLNALTTQSDLSYADATIKKGGDAVYNVIRLTRETKNGSNLGLIGADRFYRDGHSGSLGLTSTLFFTDVLGMTSQLIKTWGKMDQGTWAGFIRPAYDSPFTHFHVRYSHYGAGVMENINPVGFVVDDDRREFDTNLRRQFWINRYGIDQFTARVNYNRYTSQAGILRSWEDENSLIFQFLKKWEWIVTHTEEFKRYEKDFRNTFVNNTLQYDTKQGTIVSAEYTFGKNFERNFDNIKCGLGVKVLDGWDVEYNLSRFWFSPGSNEDNAWIHYVRSTYYVNPDLYFKVFYQTKYSLWGNVGPFDYDLLRKNLQLLFVWRFLPPFGSLQLAYQEGRVRYTGSAADDLKAFFCKLSWIL